MSSWMVIAKVGTSWSSTVVVALSVSVHRVGAWRFTLVNAAAEIVSGTSAARFLPDVVVLDIAMPKLDGYEAARKIREQPWGKHMVLIALTGWGQQQDRRRTQEAGFDAHLTKPVNYEAIMELLANLPTHGIAQMSHGLPH